MEGIISRSQSIDHMRFGSRYPFFHDFSVFTYHLERSAFYFFLPGNVRLRDLRHSWLILHFLGDLDHFQCRVCIGSVHFDGFRIWQISRQMFDLPDLIFPVGKVRRKDKGSVFPGGCLFDQGASFHQNASICTGDIISRIQAEHNACKRFPGLGRFLHYGKIHFLSLVLNLFCHIVHCNFLSLIGNGKVFFFRIQDKGIAGLGLFDIVIAYRKVIKRPFSVLAGYNGSY